ncbi:nascent polypeptide-associated complex subunit alpha, muscle-specific form-like [Monodon monoceros]|uniref:nascent polypeptide-associated complex subunit alpha, muscle-specific form-like n=1 Tax=Monodon monoceros TaxID=40151 RepID=UPI0010F59154|nr:nascent polypeptide-associated complex subunit alpha, muscle-specific form-like [Monodon monoceros]
MVPRRPPARAHHPFRAQRSRPPLGPWSAPAPRGAMAPPGTSPPRTRWPRATPPGRLIRTRRGVQSSAHRGWLGSRAEVGGGRGRGKARPQRLPRPRPAPPTHPHGRKEPSPKPGSAPPPLRGVRHLFEPLFSSGTTRLIIPTYLPVKEGRRDCSESPELTHGLQTSSSGRPGPPTSQVSLVASGRDPGSASASSWRRSGKVAAPAESHPGTRSWVSGLGPEAVKAA